MKKLLISLFALTLLLSAIPAMAGGLSDLGTGLSSKPGLTVHPEASLKSPTLFGKKKKRGKRWLAVGVVTGAPTGLGGRVLVTPWRLGLAADVSFNNVILSNGFATAATTVKVDGRFYGKGILCNFLRPYVLGGITTTMANFNEFDKMLTRVDAGVGAELRIWRFGVNGEVGVLVPMEQIPNYRSGLSFFGNLGFLFFLV